MTSHEVLRHVYTTWYVLQYIQQQCFSTAAAAPVNQLDFDFTPNRWAMVVDCTGEAAVTTQQQCSARPMSGGRRCLLCYTANKYLYEEVLK